MVEKLFLIDEFTLGKLAVLEGKEKIKLLKEIHNLFYILDIPHKCVRRLGNVVDACIIINDKEVNKKMIKELKKYNKDMLKG